MSHWEEVLRQRQDRLERLYLLADLGMPRCPPAELVTGESKFWTSLQRMLPP